MAVALITGSCGLIGSEATTFFLKKGFDVVGIDNDLRAYFFGPTASTGSKLKDLRKSKQYSHHRIDIRQQPALAKLFKKYSNSVSLIIHTAAQPSHDWAAREPLTDFGVNATGTLHLLELMRQHCPKAVFIFTSTNKVYGDTPNRLPLVELSKRLELNKKHPYYEGIDEGMSIDHTTHSLFGASKVAADILVQEYGRYFGLKTVAFRGGCLTGPRHQGAMLHGFLSYLMKCGITGQRYTIIGYKGKQVRDNIHSYDLVNAFYHFFQRPRSGEVYNIGGGRRNSCSVLEAIDLIEAISGRKMHYDHKAQARQGDHMWYISNLKKFQSHYPKWQQKYDLKNTLQEMHEEMSTSLQAPHR